MQENFSHAKKSFRLSLCPVGTTTECPVGTTIKECEHELLHYAQM